MVIETYGLTKSYGEKTGCNNISIHVESGEVFGFLGPNGAGKSTFIKTLNGLLFPTSGTAIILGKPLGDIKTRKRIGYLPENFKYQDWMTGFDLLKFHASLFKLDLKASKIRIEEVLELVGLKGNEKYKIGTYSKGMQQRLGLASSLLSNPDLLFLDEPTSALDPIGRKEVREIISSLKLQGKTVLLNSHLLSEVEMVCDSLAIISKGEIIAKGKMKDMLSSKQTLTIHAGNLSDDTLSRLRSLDSLLLCENGTVRMNIASRELVPDIARMIVENGGDIYELTLKGESLESMFLNLVEGGGK